jgi:hypothetical protein
MGRGARTMSGDGSRCKARGRIVYDDGVNHENGYRELLCTVVGKEARSPGVRWLVASCLPAIVWFGAHLSSKSTSNVP